MKTVCELLHTMPLFEHLDCARIEQLLKETRAVSRAFEAGETLLRQGEHYRSLWILLRGECAGEMTDPGGRTVRVEEFNPPYALATGILFQTENEMPVNVVARTDGEALIIPREGLKHMLAAEPRMLELFLNDISEKLAFLARRLFYFNFKTIRERVAHFLLERSKGRDRVTPPRTMEELANYFGVARQSLYRALDEMEADGVIRREGMTFFIVDRERLSGK